MNASHSGDRENRTPRGPSERALSGTVGTAEHCLCGFTGFLITVAIAALHYPTLVALTRPLHLLSSTALTFILAAIWFVTWWGLELAWEWRAGRLTAET